VVGDNEEETSKGILLVVVMENFNMASPSSRLRLLMLEDGHEILESQIIQNGSGGGGL